MGKEILHKKGIVQILGITILINVKFTASKTKSVEDGIDKREF